MSWRGHIGKERVILTVLLSLIVIVGFKACWDLSYSEPPCEEAKEDRRIDNKVLKLTSMEVAQEDKEATMNEIIDDQKERNERYRLSVIEEEKEREQAWRDSVLEVIEREHDARYAYIQLLHEIDEMFEIPGPEIGYFLFDITQNGIPEIWVVAGHSHADMVFNGYTYRNNKVVCIHEGFGCCSDFYLNKEAPYIVQEYEHMSHEQRLKHAYNGRIIETSTIFNCRDDHQRLYAFERYKKVLEATPYEEKVELHRGLTPILKMYE